MFKQPPAQGFPFFLGRCDVPAALGVHFVGDRPFLCEPVGRMLVE